MILEVYEFPEDQPRVISGSPDAAMIETTVKGLAWADITFVTLKLDEGHWMEGSGSLNPEDGLSGRYMQGGEEFVSTRPPDSLEEIVALLQSYLVGDGRWRDMMEWE